MCLKPCTIASTSHIQYQEDIVRHTKTRTFTKSGSKASQYPRRPIALVESLPRLHPEYASTLESLFEPGHYIRLSSPAVHYSRPFLERVINNHQRVIIAKTSLPEFIFHQPLLGQPSDRKETVVGQPHNDPLEYASLKKFSTG